MNYTTQQINSFISGLSEEQKKQVVEQLTQSSKPKNQDVGKIKHQNEEYFIYKWSDFNVRICHTNDFNQFIDLLHDFLTEHEYGVEVYFDSKHSQILKPKDSIETKLDLIKNTIIERSQDIFKYPNLSIELFSKKNEIIYFICYVNDIIKNKAHFDNLFNDNWQDIYNVVHNQEDKCSYDFKKLFYNPYADTFRQVIKIIHQKYVGLLNKQNPDYIKSIEAFKKINVVTEPIKSYWDLFNQMLELKISYE